MSELIPSVELHLPYPLSANRYWTQFTLPGKDGGKRRMMQAPSPQAKAFKADVARICAEAGVAAPLQGRIRLELDLFPACPKDWQKRSAQDPAGWAESVKCIDLDNANKVLLDALNEVAIKDDRWVREIVARRLEPQGSGGAVVRLASMQDARPEPAIVRAGVAQVELPYPVSANRYWKVSTRAREGVRLDGKDTRMWRSPSNEAKQFKNVAFYLCRHAGIRKALDCPLRVELDLHPPLPADWERRAAKDPLHWDDSVQCIDLDNANKVVMDALKGAAFTDDKLVRQLHVRRLLPEGAGKTVVRVMPI